MQHTILRNREDPAVILREEGIDNRLLVATESDGHEARDLVEAHKLEREVFRPSQEESRVVGPGDSCDVLAMQIAVLLEDGHWVIARTKNVWSVPNPHLCSSCRDEEVAVGRVGTSRHSAMEAEPASDDLSDHVTDQGKPVDINNYQGIAIRRHYHSVDGASGLKRECSSHIPKTDQTTQDDLLFEVKTVDFVSHRTEKELLLSFDVELHVSSLVNSTNKVRELATSQTLMRIALT